jgi:hypothetical protein
VFVEADGRAVLPHVTLGQRSGTEAHIAEGLAEGERVLHPSDRVGNGVRVAAPH